MRAHTEHGNVVKVAVGYVRVSPLEQAAEGVSLDAQRDKLCAYCKFNSIKLIGITARAHLTSLPLHTGKHRLIYLIKERWRTEMVYREMKQELGLDHYQGRRWQGFNHHVSVVLCCYAFVVALRERAEPP